MVSNNTYVHYSHFGSKTEENNSLELNWNRRAETYNFMYFFLVGNFFILICTDILKQLASPQHQSLRLNCAVIKEYKSLLQVELEEATCISTDETVRIIIKKISNNHLP